MAYGQSASSYDPLINSKTLVYTLFGNYLCCKTIPPNIDLNMTEKIRLSSVKEL